MKKVNKKENRKAFFRILKEARLYSEWVRCRRKRKAIGGSSDNTLFECLNFSDILIYSFGWDESKVNNLWCTLSRIKLTSSEIVKNKKIMDDIKSTVKKFIDNSKPIYI